MTIHSLYIFSKSGTCLFYHEWFRPRSTLAETPEEDRKLMFGLLFSMKQLMNKMNPFAYVLRSVIRFVLPRGSRTLHLPVCSEPPSSAAPSSAASFPPALPPAGPDQGFYKIGCSHYVIHHLETPTGYRFALTSDASAGDLRAPLWHIYSELFVGFALKNPMYTPGTTIVSAGFIRELDAFARALPAFASK